MFDSQSQFYWRNGIADDGSEHRMCELEECSLFVDSVMFSFLSPTRTTKSFARFSTFLVLRRLRSLQSGVEIV